MLAILLLALQVSSTNAIPIKRAQKLASALRKAAINLEDDSRKSALETAESTYTTPCYSVSTCPTGVFAIPDGTTCIEPGVFENCLTLIKITIPEGVTEIPQKFCDGCNNLTHAFLPDTLLTIGQEAFKNTQLSTIAFPEGLETISSDAFLTCTFMQNVVIPESVTEIQVDAFLGCTNAGCLLEANYGNPSLDITFSPVPPFANPRLCVATCYDETQNNGETGVDCGGPCPHCPTCSDGVRNGNEEGDDCGGSCPSCQNGSVQDDPHFVGFDGSTYDFQGTAGVVFNIISDVGYQLNAMFIEPPVDSQQTFMGVLAFLIGEDRVMVSPTGVVFNGKTIKPDHLDFHPLRPDSQGRTPGFIHVDTEKTIVRSRGFRIILTAHKDKGFSYMNMDAQVTAHQINNPHGLLGQTCMFIVDGTAPTPVKMSHSNKNAKGFIEGSPTDYHVADGLFGSQYTFNRFDDVPNLHLATRYTGKTFSGESLFQTQDA